MFYWYNSANGVPIACWVWYTFSVRPLALLLSYCLSLLERQGRFAAKTDVHHHDDGADGGETKNFLGAAYGHTRAFLLFSQPACTRTTGAGIQRKETAHAEA